MQVEIYSYAVTQAQIDAYKGNKDQEDVELLASVDATMMAIKDDLKKYLGEMGEKFGEDKKEEKQQQEGILSPFTAMFSVFKDLFSLFKTDKKKTSESFFGFKEKKLSKKDEVEKKKAEDFALSMAWIMYDVFKKVNKMYSTI